MVIHTIISGVQKKVVVEFFMRYGVPIQNSLAVESRLLFVLRLTEALQGR